MRAYCKTEGFKKRIQKVSVSPWPSWVLSPPDTFTFDALGLRAHRPTQRRQWHWLLAVSTGMTGYIHWCDQSSIYLFWQIACGRPPAGRRTAAQDSWSFLIDFLVKFFIGENKLKTDATPEVGGEDSWSFLIVFPVKFFIWENKLKTDPTPEVGGEEILDHF